MNAEGYSSVYSAECIGDCIHFFASYVGPVQNSSTADLESMDHSDYFFLYYSEVIKTDCYFRQWNMNFSAFKWSYWRGDEPSASRSLLSIHCILVEHMHDTHKQLRNWEDGFIIVAGSAKVMFKTSRTQVPQARIHFFESCSLLACSTPPTPTPYTNKG